MAAAKTEEERASSRAIGLIPGTKGRPLPSSIRKRAAELLATGLKFQEVCTRLHIGRTTLREWLNEEDFSEDVAEIEARIREAAILKVGDLKGTALYRLKQIIEDPTTEMRYLLEAIKIVLRYTETPPARILQIEGAGGGALPAGTFERWTPEQLVAFAFKGQLSPTLLDIQPDDEGAPTIVKTGEP